jgi:DnaJ-class molecular chaperone
MIRKIWLSLFPKRCEECGGSGVMALELMTSWGLDYVELVCRVCRGKGKVRS